MVAGKPDVIGRTNLLRTIAPVTSLYPSSRLDKYRIKLDLGEEDYLKTDKAGNLTTV